jgi:hypothetical protein
MDEWVSVEFIGGPLDGQGRIHPAMNDRLRVKDNPGVYVLVPSPYSLGSVVYVWYPNDPDAEHADY